MYRVIPSLRQPVRRSLFVCASIGTGIAVGIAVSKYSHPNLSFAQPLPETLKAAPVTLATVEAEQDAEQVVEIKISVDKSSLAVFSFHQVMYRVGSEVVWKPAQASLVTQVACWIGSVVSGSLAYPWLIVLCYQDMIRSNPWLRDAIDVNFSGTEFILPLLKNLVLNLVTFGTYSMLGFSNIKLAETAEKHMKFKKSKLVQFK